MVLGGPAERWCIDLTGPHPTSDGYRYLFTAIDSFTQYVVAVPIRNKEAHTVAKALVEHVFLKWGLCFEILSDLGKEFESSIMQELLRISGVVKLRTTAYRPQCNGAIESWHRVMNSLFAHVINENQKDWNRWTNYIVFCYNAAVQSSTGFSPHFLMTGQEVKWTVDFCVCQCR
jgi:transposase InsO family protein